MKRMLTIWALAAVLLTGAAGGAAGAAKPVPEIDFLTWVPAKFSAYFETSRYIADEWEKLGLKVKLNQANLPNPLLTYWFKEHKFDVVLSVLSGLPYRMEPDFFTNAQFNSKHAAPGNWNVGEFSNPGFDKIGGEQLAIYDPEKRRPLIYKLQEILWEEVPEAPVYYQVQKMGMNTDRCSLDYSDAPDGLRSIWNQVKITPKVKVKFIKVGRISDQQTWNPLAVIQSDDFEMLRMVYDRLVQVGPKGEVKMWAATSVKRVDDLTIDVELRKGLKFSDGKPLTAEDVKFSYDYMKKWKSAYFLKYIKPIKGVKILSPSSLRFTLNKPFAPFVMNTLGQVFILPKHIWENVIEKEKLTKPQDYQNNPLIGSGPFVRTYWKESAEFLMKANKDHFMAPKADLLFIVFGSRELCNAALKKGSIDISIQNLPAEVVKDFQNQKNIQVFDVRENGYTAVRFNCGRPLFKNKALRQALAHAIPYQAIIDEIRGGFASTTASGITPVNAFWHNPNLKVREFNLDKAKAILKKAGFTWNAEGRLCYPAQ